MALLRLYLLGVPRFEHDGASIDPPSAKAVALLAYLGLNAEPQPRERLFALLWGGSTEEAARKNLRNTLWNIGRSLGDHVLRVDEQLLALSPDVWADAREFERLANSADPTAALDLYKGDLLASFSLPDAPEYEIWLTSERGRIAGLYLQLLSDLVEQAQSRGDWHAVIDLARRALGQDNLQEPLYRAQMEAYARLGDRTRALQQYEFLKATLRNELDVDPLPETARLRDTIASGALGPPVTPTAPTPRQSRVAHPVPAVPRIPFVGRQSELAALDAEWAAARAGTAHIALVTGELGIGKTRLWQEWSAPLGDAALATRCLEATSAVPYAPVAELFRPRPVLQRLLSPSASISPVWLAELARLLPEIRAARPDLPVLAALPAEEEHRRVLEAFTQCVRALRGSALALFVDDLPWADGATLDWLDYMVHRLADQPILVVATYRPEDAPARLVQLAARWGREGISRRIPVGSLTEAEAAALVSAVGAPQAGPLQQSGGNPYFLIELAQAGPGTLPPALGDLVRARLDRLPGTARQILQAAAVLEPDFDFATLRRTSGRGEEETLDAVDALLGANILVERDGAYGFAHPLVGLVEREGLSGARRAFLHRRAAKAIQATAARPEQFAARLADHYAEAGDPARAAHYAEIAAQNAVALAAPEQALAFYRRALELEPSPERRIGAGSVLLGQGELEQARREFTQALEESEQAGNRPSAARAAMSVAESYFPAGQFAQAQQWLEKSFQLLQAGDDAESRALLLLLRGSSELNAGQPGTNAELNLFQATELGAAGGHPEVAARASFMLGNVLAERGDLSAAMAAYTRAEELARQAGDDYQQALAHNNLAYHALLSGDLERAHAEIEQGLALTEARALRLPLQHLYSTRGEIALAEKNWPEAKDWLKRGLAEAERNGNRREQANSHANLGLAAMGHGDPDAAVMLLETARQEVSELPEPHLRARIDLDLAQVYVQRGESAAAREALDRARADLTGGSRKTLEEWADRLEKQIGPARRGRNRRQDR